MYTFRLGRQTILIQIKTMFFAWKIGLFGQYQVLSCFLTSLIWTRLCVVQKIIIGNDIYVCMQNMSVKQKRSFTFHGIRLLQK